MSCDVLHAPPWKCIGKKKYLLTIAVQHGGGVDLHISREEVPASARVLAKLILVPLAVTLVPETKPQPRAPEVEPGACRRCARLCNPFPPS